MPNPTGKGGFSKGTSGNPGGRHRSDLQDLIRKVTNNGQVLVDRLMEIATDKDAKKADSVRASEVLFARGWGLPRQEVDVAGEDGGPVQVTVVQYPKEEGGE